MKKAPYMNSAELPNFLKVGVFASELEDICQVVTEKAWKQKMKTCVTYLTGIIEERIASLDNNAKVTLLRRKNHTKMLMRTSDQHKVKGVESNLVTVGEDDLFELAELALNSCTVCREGGCVKDCRFRLVMHRLGIPAANDTPDAGKCEFKAVDRLGKALSDARKEKENESNEIAASACRTGEKEAGKS